MTESKVDKQEKKPEGPGEHEKHLLDTGMMNMQTLQFIVCTLLPNIFVRLISPRQYKKQIQVIMLLSGKRSGLWVQFAD